MKIVIKETQLRAIVEKYKIDADERLKLYENDDFLLVAPLTHTASCKYGSGTKWCVTEKNSEMFERHYDVGSLAFLIVKNPEIQDKLNNTKFAFYVNKPSYDKSADDLKRVIVYDDADNVMPLRSFLNFADNSEVYLDVKNILNKFMEYSKNKFSPENFEMIRRGTKNPF